MKDLVTYINEAIKKLERNVKGIIVFDIDDTLLQADDKIIKIYKRKPGEDEVTLTTSEFANDPDAEDFLNTSTIEFTNNLKGRKMLNTLEAIEILIDTHLQEDLFFDKYPGREYLMDENSKESIDNALKHQKVTFLDVQGYSKTSDERISELKSLDDVSKSNIHLLVSESLERFSRQDPDFKKFFDKYIVTNEQKMYLYESLEKAAQYDNKGNRSLDLLTFKNAVVEYILKENGKDILDNDDTLLSKYIC